MQLRDDKACQAAECGQAGERGQERPVCLPRPVTGSCSVRPPRGPAARWVHACDGAIPASSACPATVTAVSQRSWTGGLAGPDPGPGTLAEAIRGGVMAGPFVLKSLLVSGFSRAGCGWVVARRFAGT